MGLGADQITTTTGANFNPELWIPTVKKATEANLTMWKLTWDWTDGSKGKGDTIHVPDLSNLTDNAKSGNSQVTLNAVTENKTDLNIDQHRECSFLLEDIEKVQSAYNLMQMYTGKCSYAIAKRLDTNVNALVASISQIVGSSGADLGDGDVRDSIEFLDLADAPGENRYLLVYPTQKNSLMSIQKYFDASIKPDTPVLAKGMIGNLYGIPTFVSTNIGTSGGARLNCMWHKEAFATVKQSGPRTQGSYIQEYLGTLVTVDCIFGSVESRDDHAVWMKS